jgi:Secretion system C-terminal sorting domain
MKKIFLFITITCIACSSYSQSCGEVEGIKPIQLFYAFNGNNPETTYPVIPSNWNRFYKLNETTGELMGDVCVFPSTPLIALCVCWAQGTYFRRVTPPCDPTPCGGDLPLPGMPKTDNNNPENKWSQTAAWVGGQVPVIASSPAIVISKSLQIDANLTIPPDHWLVFTAGTSFISAANTITINSVLRVGSSAVFTNFGVINGTGKVYGNLINSGTLAPGNSPGKFTVTGNYTATNTAVHNIEIGAINLFDTLSIEQDVSFASGTAVINGTLNVSLLNGYIPSIGESYKIITYTAGSGNFSAINFPVLPPGMVWSVSYNATNITLNIIAGTLPLHFTNTKAWIKNNGVQIEWTAENEINVKEYAVEKSTDGRLFTKIATLNANSNGSKNYSSLDAVPFNNNNYYRIKAIDNDGRFMYSVILLVKISGDKEIIVYPNPVKRGEPLQISLQNITANKIEMINTAGQIVYSNSQKQTGSISIPIQGAWPAGQYIIRIISDRELQLQKIQLQ